MSQTLAAGSGSARRSPADTAGRGHLEPSRTSARGAERPRPTLRVVAAPVAGRSRTSYVVGCLALLAGGLIMLLLLNTSLAQGSFSLQRLQSASRQLADQSQALTEDIAAQAAPQMLSKRAAALGMVPSGSVAFIRLSDARVLGVATPAPAPPAPTVTATATPAAGTTATTGPAVITLPGTKKPSTRKPSTKKTRTTTPSTQQAKSTAKPTAKPTTAPTTKR